MKKLALVLCVLAAHEVTAQVSLQSGRATFSLPIFNWQDSKSKLNTQTVLYYNSGNGLKVNDIASNIGQGWDLALGGVITRIQVGQPDDQVGQDGPYYDFTKYPNGYLYNTRSISDGCPVAIGEFPIFTTRNVQYKQHNTVEDDRELDYFSYEFNGRQGKFILTKNNNDQCINLGDSKLKIWFERDATAMGAQGIRTAITAFYIQDETGILYKFRQKSIYKVLQVKYTDDAGNPITSVPNGNADQRYMESYFDDLSASENPNVVNAWYLSEVEDLLTHRTITYTYTTNNIFTETGKTVTFNWSSEKHAIVSINRSKYTQPRVTEVNYPDGHKLQLYYGMNRFDLDGDAVLDAITVHYQNTFLSKYQFLTSYFIKNVIATPVTNDEKKAARLCLTTLRKYDTKEWDHDTYSFNYYLGTNSTEDFVPLPFMYSRDLWGYYNGDHSGVPLNNSPKDFEQCGKLAFVHIFAPNTAPKLGYAKNGLLKTITYPTGSTLTYEYEQNKFTDNTQTDIYIGGVRVSNTILSDGTNNNTSDIVTSYSYTLSNGKSSLWGYEPPVNSLSKPVFFRAETPYAIVGIPPCNYRYKYPGIMDRKSEATRPEVGNAVAFKFLKSLNIASVFLEAYLSSDRNFSAGMSAVIADDLDRTGGISLDCPTDPGRTISTSVYKNFDLYSINPLPLQYKRVEVKIGGLQANRGSSIHEFTSDAEYPLTVPSNASSHSMKQRYPEWAYGQPKSVTVMDNSGNPVKQTLYTYDWSNTVVALTSSTSCKCYTPKFASRGDDSWNTSAHANTFTSTSTDYITVDQYTLYTGRVELSEMKEREFKDASNYQETKTKFEYNPANLMVKKTEQTLSNQDKAITETFYTVDYTATGVLQTLKNNNIISVPVASYKSVIKSQLLNPSYLGAEVTEFTAIANGDIRPHRIYLGRSASPVSGFTFNPANPLNYPDLKEVRQNIFDNNSDLVKIKNEGNRITSKILDYDGRFVTAIAVNANPDEIAYTSFETSNTGNWMIQGGEYRDDPYNAPTGKRIYYLNTYDPNNPPITRTGLNSSNTYLVSYWAKDGTLLVNSLAAQPVFSVNGWSLYVHEVAAASSVLITGEALIDELRLYPRNASMITFSYDVVFGKTSECDANNRISYFSYSPFGELILIQDQGRNAMKAFEYRYKNRTRKTFNIH